MDYLGCKCRTYQPGGIMKMGLTPERSQPQIFLQLYLKLANPFPPVFLRSPSKLAGSPGK